MSDLEPIQAGLRVTAGLDFLRTAGGEDVREHYLWQLKQMMLDMPPEKISTSALVSLVAVLIPEHARVLAGRQPASGVPVAVLRLVRDDGAAG